MTVKISAKSARLPFHGCTPEYIATTCHARCCRSSTAPTGTVITIHPSEQSAIESIGGVVADGLLQPKPGCKKCPFQNDQTHLCDIHFTPHKPFGCIASPFTLNKNGTLIVRNRYRLLSCYNAGPKLPAYVAFRASLDLIFGAVEASRICTHLASGGGDISAEMPDENHAKLIENDNIKSASMHPETPPVKTPQTSVQEKRQPTEPVVRCAYTSLEDPRTLRPNPRNPNEHPPEQIRLLLKIIDSTGWRNPIVVSKRSGLVTKGHGRLESALLGNYTLVPVDFQDYDTEEQETADVLADNLVGEFSTMNRAGMQQLLAELTAAGHDAELAGILQVQQDLAARQRKAAGALKQRFIVPPFTLLDARSGSWMERRQLWLQLGIASELGREGNLTYANSSQPPHLYEAKNTYEQLVGRSVSWDEFIDQHPNLAGVQTGTSTFNPVLCEIMYNWFLPTQHAGKILDPFAGGSVRGIVAAVLGHAYTGIELRHEQVVANIENANAIFEAIGEPKHRPQWITGDSTKLDDLLPTGEKYDLVFSCPPYGDLEVYSEDTADLSNMPEPRFREAYAAIIKAASARLLPNRFSIWVVGDYRDKKTGNLRNFVNTTINAHPFPLYNHAVFLMSVSSLAIRIGRSFPKQRKLGKAHQDAVILYNGDRLHLEAAAQAAFENVVAFYNGAANKIPENLGPISARDIVPLGDILQSLTEKPTP